MTRNSIRTIFCAVGVATFATACADATAPQPELPPTPPLPPPPVVSVVGGNVQWSFEGTAVDKVLRVRVSDSLSGPLAGVQVVFSVSSGGGTIANGQTTTDENGIAVSGAWTLGSASQTQRVTARSGTGAAEFTAVAMSRPSWEVASGVVFARANSVFRTAPNGARSVLLQQRPDQMHAAAVSPNGSQVAVLPTEGGVCVVDLQGSSERCTQLDGYSLSHTRFAWSPDGNTILLQATPFSVCGRSRCFENKTHLLSLDVATLHVTPLVAETSGYASGAAWSPDGATIAFSIRGEIWLIDRNGSNRRKLSSPFGSYHAWSIAWSPDGRKLAVGVFDENQCPWYCDTGIGIVDLSENTLQLLVTRQESQNLMVSGPLWSPEGTHIMFQESDLRTSDVGHVSMVKASGGPSEVVLLNASLLAWH